MRILPFSIFLSSEISRVGIPIRVGREISRGSGSRRLLKTRTAPPFSIATSSTSLHSNFTSPLFLSSNQPKTSKPTPPSFLPIRAGPRSNRGPLLKGRILSTEAILALQSLKRANRINNNLPNLSRLIKSDLVSMLHELLRQNQCSLALQVLRSEYPDESGENHGNLLDLYADVIFSLGENGLSEGIDALVDDVEGVLTAALMRRPSKMDKGMVRLIRGVVEGRRRESTVKICGLMKKSGCGDSWTADEYVVKVLSRGLREMEEVELASEVEREFDRVLQGNLDKSWLASLP